MNKVTKRTKVLYGLGAFGYGSIGQTMGTFLMFFGTAVLGIPGALMGLAIAIGTICDATTDPIVGHLSDKTKSKRFGKRHGYILVGCIAVALINLMIWSINPAWPVMAKFLMMVALLVIIETFCTVYSTPYGALGLDLAKTYDERTAIQGFKTVFSFLSLLVPFALMTWLLTPTEYVTMEASTRGYRQMALFTGALCIICGLICFFGTIRHRQRFDNKEEVKSVSIRDSSTVVCFANQSTEEKNNFRNIFTNFFSIIKQKNVGLLIAGYAASLSAGAFITTLGLHVFTYTFGFSTIEIPIIMVCLIAGIVLGQPFWFNISRRLDKPTTLMYALFTVILGIIIFALILSFRNTLYPSQVLPIVALAVTICGIGTGCLYSLPISMFADMIDLNNKKTGTDKTALAAGFLTFCTKISNALIMFIIGVSLDLIGFSGGTAVQSMSTQNWLGTLLVVGVTIACITSLIVYSKYSYNRDDFE